TETPDIIPWLTYFLRSLQKQIERLEFTIKREQITRASLPKLADEILQLIHTQKKVTVTDVLKVTNASRSTIKKHLSLLIDQKYLIRHGKGRSTWYTSV